MNWVLKKDYIVSEAERNVAQEERVQKDYF